MKKNYFLWAILIVFLLSCLPDSSLLAQCPMCKAAAESNLKEGGTFALGLNSGILYLLVAPYIIVSTLGYWWWRNNKKTEMSQSPQ